jgi:preprotein translocase subunit SecG
VGVAIGKRGDGAGDTGDKGLGVVEAEVLLTKTKGDNAGSGAGTGAAGISVVVAKVDEFVDKVVVCCALVD